MKNSRFWAYAQLVRLPNVFTAVADIVMAGLFTGAIAERPLAFVGIVVASVALYLSGMAWNDFFDRHEDARSRPFRPIPSGRISPGAARRIAGVLMAAGVAIAFGVCALNAVDPQTTTFQISCGLAVLILLYNAWLKHTWLGPLAMGGCRFLNVLMGLSLTNFVNIPVELALHIAGVVGLYIVGVTWFARTEEGQSRPRWLVAATLVMLVSLGLLLGLPLHFPPGSTTFLVPYLIVAFGAYLARAILPAIRSPEPKPVQHA
ncbi:MAG: UbiA family prenyltransferase, partial [Gemmataceae bacterium]